MYPSPIIDIDKVTYYLKAIVRHFGGLAGGHYNTALYMETLWVICDDFKEFTSTDEVPDNGYLFFL